MCDFFSLFSSLSEVITLHWNAIIFCLHCLEITLLLNERNSSIGSITIVTALALLVFKRKETEGKKPLISKRKWNYSKKNTRKAWLNSKWVRRYKKQDAQSFPFRFQCCGCKCEKSKEKKYIKKNQINFGR